jgi:hypothetical protein
MKHLKKLAMVESLANVGSGLLLSVFVFQPIIFYVYDISLSVTENIVIAAYFTIISIFRGFIWRLYFHKWFYNSAKN